MTVSHFHLDFHLELYKQHFSTVHSIQRFTNQATVYQTHNFLYWCSCMYVQQL